MKAVFALLPTSIDRRIKVFVLLSLVVQVLIVATGGAVRLTGSGLGCPTWPLCTDESLVATAEMGIHGAIEFGNRLLSIIVGLVAVATAVLLLRLRSQRRDLWVLSLLVLGGTVLQGLIGGISVRVQLDPTVVGIHFGISALLVVFAATLVYRTYLGRRGGRLSLPRWFTALVHVTSLAVAVTIVVGILTTGSGPHAGDAASDRNGLDPELLQHIHSWPAYIALGLTVVVVAAAFRFGMPWLTRSAVALLVIELSQVVVGVTQARLGLPPLLVGIHMVLACVLAAAMAWVVLSLREAVPAEEPVSPVAAGA